MSWSAASVYCKDVMRVRQIDSSVVKVIHDVELTHTHTHTHLSLCCNSQLHV